MRSNERLSYGWREVHADLEKGHTVGCYGADHAPYHGLAAVRAGVDMDKHQSVRSPYEYYLPELESLFKSERVQAMWESITTFDPLGMWSTRPTHAGTYAIMSVPELAGLLTPDPKIVNEDGSINCVKYAIDHVWNLPALAQVLSMDETVMRKALAHATQNEHLLDTSVNAYLPPIGGVTLYIMGDPSKLADPATEVAVRCHDACCGSDVFGTDICTCRPYLVYAIQGAAETAQRGGVGVIVYFRKEGRSLGEVIKYRVYNARKAQPGGDTPENYFRVTESIAGIRDARFQEMMADVLLFLGIKRIDWLLSMSGDKYDAIVSAGIEVMQRVPLPNLYVPKGATVEITAKIASGYHTDTINDEEIINDLRTLECVRSRCNKVFDLALRGKSRHFSVDISKMGAAVDYVLAITRKAYPTLDVPYHSRWRHFLPEDISAMSAKWPVDAKERARRLIDLVTISVLLDAGAGPDWTYTDAEGKKWSRSEGLAVASLDMFKDGLFSSDPAMTFRANSHALKRLELKAVAKGLQVSKSNPMVGLEGRFGLLQRLGSALEAHPEFFGAEMPRPGNVVDYILENAGADGTISVRKLWKALIEGLEGVWPEDTRTHMRRGDVWGYTPLKTIGVPGSDMLPFHKLTQWLAYSMLEPIEQLGLRVTDIDLLTALSEYRNGGFVLDIGLLQPKKPEELTTRVAHDPGSEFVVEWRALTVVLLDKLAVEARRVLGLTPEQFPLPKLLQGGTWMAGRAIAQEKRGGAPPFAIRSDGTVF